MSDKEEMAARGQLVTDYMDRRQHLVSLETQANKLGEVLRGLGEALVNQPATVTLDGGPIGVNYERWNFDSSALDKSKIVALVEDIRNTKDEKNRLRQRISTLGLPVED